MTKVEGNPSLSPPRTNHRLRSSVLIVMHPDPSTVSLGADFANDFQSAIVAVQDGSYPVIIVPCTNENFSAAQSFLEQVTTASPLSQRVIIQTEVPPEDLVKIVNLGSIFRILPSFADDRFDHAVQEALEEYRHLQQNTKLLQLVREQNERLVRLSADLEDRVEGRRQSLEHAKERLLITNHRIEALHRALVAIHRASSVAEMERLINEALAGALDLTWTRVLFRSQARLTDSKALHGVPLALHSVPLNRDKEVLGHIYFAREESRPFVKDEIGFLGQIAEAVSLAVDRLTKIDQSETLKQQWDATFDAILEPVSLMAPDYTLVRVNRSFLDQSGAEVKIAGKKCYEMLFGRQSPCDDCKIGATNVNKNGSRFQLKPSQTAAHQLKTYDVYSQSIPFKPEEKTLFVNMYRDVSAQLRSENQILEAARMAELGTIGSSIAHELNNPLGGMLNFLQLIKMDLRGDEPWFSDVTDLEEGVRRCQEIVQSLLGFSRKSHEEEVGVTDLREVIKQTLDIIELQTRSLGVQIVVDIPEAPVMIKAPAGMLSQALRNLMQISPHPETKQVSDDHFLKIYLTSDESCHRIEIQNHSSAPTGITNEVYENPPEDSDISISKQIILDLGGSIEIRSTRTKGTSAKITLPRPVFDR